MNIQTIQISDGDLKKPITRSYSLDEALEATGHFQMHFVYQHKIVYSKTFRSEAEKVIILSSIFNRDWQISNDTDSTYGALCVWRST